MRLAGLSAALIVAVTAIMAVAVQDQESQDVEVRARTPEPGTLLTEKLGVGTASISGAVVDGTTSVPIAGTIVNLGRTDVRTPLKSVICDSQGRFVFTELPAGTLYTLAARRSGYLESPYARQGSEQGPASRPSEIAVGTGQWRQGLQIRMWRLGSISGQVLDERGEPLVGVAVRAFTTAAVGPKSYLAGAALAATDDRGFYRVPGLDPGPYLVAIVSPQATVPDSIPERPQQQPVGALFTGGPPDRATPSVSGPTVQAEGRHRLVVNSLALSPATDQGVPTAYRPVFYPAALTPSDAQLVIVGYGSNREDVDFRLHPVPTFRVSGRVPSGMRLDAAPFLRLLPSGYEGLGLGNEVATTVLEQDGSFTFLGVPSGPYTLLAQSGVMEFVRQPGGPRMPDPAGFSAGPIGMGSFPATPNLAYLERTGPPASVWGRLSITVLNSDVDDVVVPLQPTLSIRGRVELDAGTVLPPSQRAVGVTAEPANGDQALGSRSVSAGRGDGSYAFSLDGLQPGVYLLRGSYFPVMSVTWRGRDVTDVGVDATAGGDIDGVVITLTGKGTELVGEVAYRGDPPQDVAVIAFPVDQALWSDYGWTPRRLRSAPVHNDGTYSIRNLPAGEYFVIAIDAAQASAWVDPLFLRAASAQASKVSLRWGSRVNQDLPLRRGLGK